MSHYIQSDTCECCLHLCICNSGWEGVNHFVIFHGDYFIIFSSIQHFSSDLVTFHCGDGSSNHQNVGHTGINPGCHQCIYLLLSYHVHDMAYCGGFQDHRDPCHEVGQIPDYEGYLILIITLDSSYLNPYDDVASRSSEGVSQACTDDLSTHEVREWPNIQGVICNETWHNGVDLGTTVQEGHASVSIDSYPGYVLDPVPSIKGVGIQEESLCLMFYTLGVLSWGNFGAVTFVWGAQASFFGAIPSFKFKCNSVLDATTNGQLWIKWSRLQQW